MTLEAAYNETGAKIVGYLVATGTDEAAARDLLHDAVLNVARWMRSRPAEDANLPALLFTTARNLRANRTRDDNRLSVVERPEDFDSRTFDGRSALSPSDAAYMRSRISSALSSLPPQLRETYTLYQIADLGVREVAEITGASENLVKVRLHRAKLALRRELADLAPPPKQAN